MKLPDFKKLFTGNSVADKRAIERVRMWEHVEGTLRNAANTAYEIEIRDLSKKGVRLACDKSFPSGTLFELEIRFPALYPGEKSVRVKVQAVHAYKLAEQRRQRIGCQFVQLDAASASQIEKFLAWMKARARKE